MLLIPFMVNVNTTRRKHFCLYTRIPPHIAAKQYITLSNLVQIYINFTIQH